jgi:DNA-binding response OmpR family regulator
VLVLDLGLPDGDGLDWLAANPQLLEHGIVITTARGELRHRVSGVRAGADAYLVKPVQLEELTSMISNLSRRLKPGPTKAWSLDQMAWQLVSPDGRTVKLTLSEHALLTRLAKSPGKAVGRQELVQSLGHDPRYYDLRRMEILVRRLRNKVRETLGYPLPLETAHSLGYAFSDGIVIRSKDN